MSTKNKIEERAAHYSFNADSALFQALPMELQSMWKQDIEQAYRAGAQEELENPTGGALLYVCRQSAARGRRDAIDDAIKVLKEKAKEPMDFENDEICKLIIKEVEKYCEPK